MLHHFSYLKPPTVLVISYTFQKQNILSHRTKDRGQTNSPELVFFKGVGATVILVADSKSVLKIINL